MSNKETKADINPEFREERRDHKVVVVKEFNEYFKVKAIESNNGESYYFAERAGVDSVAFMLFDGNREDCFGLIEQYRGNHGAFHKGMYTGSLDKPEKSLEQIVQEEVLEEAGFSIPDEDIPSRIIKVSTEHAGSLSNEQVHLYIVNVTNLEQEATQPQSVFEENTNNLWMTHMGVFHCDDWKAKYGLFMMEGFFK